MNEYKIINSEINDAGIYFWFIKNYDKKNLEFRLL